MKDFKAIIKDLRSFINRNMNIEIQDLEKSLNLLEQIREIKKQIEEISKAANASILRIFQEENVNEYYYKDKIIKTGRTTKYDCSKLINTLNADTKRQLAEYLPLKLNKKIINQAILDNVLNARTIQDYINAGLIKKSSKVFIKFCDPEAEFRRMERWNDYRLQNPGDLSH